MNAITSFTGDYRWLSNFHYGEFTYNGETYPTSEHAFQAAKAVYPEDAKSIRLCKTPRQAKDLGGKIRLRPNWDNLRVKIMTDILREKFGDAELAEKLVATGDAHLEEGNTHGDKFWGTVEGVGKNHLGRILMRIREEIR